MVQDRNFNGAIELYSKAIEAEGESDNAALCYSNRAACYQAKKEWKLCEEDAKMCIKLKPKFSKARPPRVPLLRMPLSPARARAAAPRRPHTPGPRPFTALQAPLVPRPSSWPRRHRPTPNLPLAPPSTRPASLLLVPRGIPCRATTGCRWR